MKIIISDFTKQKMPYTFLINLSVLCIPEGILYRKRKKFADISNFIIENRMIFSFFYELIVFREENWLTSTLCYFSIQTHYFLKYLSNQFYR